MKSFEGLTGAPLELWFKDFFVEDFGFLDYYPSRGQIRLQDIDPTQAPGEHLEIDGVLLVGKTCVLVECTSQHDGHRGKIHKFVRNAHIFINSPTPLRARFSRFGVPARRLLDFEDVSAWKCAYFGTAASFEATTYTKADFPEHRDVQQVLSILRPSQLEYFRQLANLTNSFAQNEFLAALGFDRPDVGEDETLQLPFVKVEGKVVTSGAAKADIYLLRFPVHILLRIARVCRYEGIPLGLDEDDSDRYQRLLIPEKIQRIAKQFIGNDSRRSFPNTLTLVLSDECEERADRLHIPQKYNAVDIIDGQHRLLAYANRAVRNTVRETAEILASAIKFRAGASGVNARHAARLFCEINSSQAKVKNNLIYLIEYDVLGRRTPEAKAGKVLRLCERSEGVLSNVFLTNALRRKNKFGAPPIPITTIVDSDLKHFVQGIGVSGRECSDRVFQSVFGLSRAVAGRRPHEHCSAAKAQIERYFGYVKTVFRDDWKPGSGSALLSAKYISALIRLLRYCLFDRRLPPDQTLAVLQTFKRGVDRLSRPSAGSPSLTRASHRIPEVKLGMTKIFGFIKRLSMSR